MSNATSITYVPGIDGLRALAVTSVILFHLGWSVMPGGAFGVTLFFTVSGYLITSLLVAEHDRTGAIGLTRFWGRRFRRLMPAALVTLGLVAVGGIVGVFEGPRLRGDILWAVGYASNWRSAAAPTTYSQLFEGSASPLLHFWSLAIEEQFYIVFPVVMWLAFRRRRTLVPILVAITVASVAFMVAVDSQNTAYYNTFSRTAELTIGALFALVVPLGARSGRTAARTWNVAGVVAFAAFAVMACTVGSGDRFMFEGALPIVSLLTTFMIAAVCVDGPMRRVTKWRPLVAVGKLSYPLYLVHWPVIVAIDERRLGFGGLGLAVVRVLVTVLISIVVARVVETPIRSRRLLANFAGAAAVAGAGITAVIVASMWVPVTETSRLAGLDAPDVAVDFGGHDAADAPPADAPGPTLRVTIIGGEEGVADLIRGAAPTGVDTVIDDLTEPRCAIRPYPGRMGTCSSLESLLSGEDVSDSADVVILAFGAAERDLISRLSGRQTAHQSAEFESQFARDLRMHREYVSAMTDLIGGRRVIILDHSSPDQLRGHLEDLAQASPSIEMIGYPEVADAKDRLGERLSLVNEEVQGVDDRLRLMVIGDSNSFAVAEGIDAVAGDRMNVLWAGGRNCPIVAVNRLRWWQDVEFDMTTCPTVDDWAARVAEFSPDGIVIVATVPEQSEQMYEPDGEWHVVGDAEFERRHDEAVARLMEVARSAGARVVMLNSPRVYGGALSGAQFAADDRVAAWNASIERFATEWPDLTVVDWATMLDRAETANGETSGSLRGDGVHMSAANMAALMRSDLVPALETILETVPPTGGG